MSQLAEEKVEPQTSRWQIIDILLDQGEQGCTYALAERDGERSIVFRWNDGGENSNGDFKGEQYSTWDKLDGSFCTAAIIKLFSIEKQVQARALLKMIPKIDDTWTFAHLSLSADCSFVILRGSSRNTRIIAQVDCNTLRAAINCPYMSGYDCRVLAEKSKALLAELAKTLLAERRCKVRKDGSVIIDIGLSDLKALADRLSIAAIDGGVHAGAAADTLVTSPPPLATVEGPSAAPSATAR